jgi:hypothetical protein
MFSTPSVLRCYKQDKFVAVKGPLGFSRRELLLLEADSWGLGQCGDPEEEKRPPLEAVTKQRQWRRDCGH